MSESESLETHTSVRVWVFRNSHVCPSLSLSKLTHLTSTDTRTLHWTTGNVKLNLKLANLARIENMHTYIHTYICNSASWITLFYHVFAGCTGPGRRILIWRTCAIQREFPSLSHDKRLVSFFFNYSHAWCDLSQEKDREIENLRDLARKAEANAEKSETKAKQLAQKIKVCALKRRNTCMLFGHRKWRFVHVYNGEATHVLVCMNGKARTLGWMNTCACVHEWQSKDPRLNEHVCVCALMAKQGP
jgi:hypothetical protein